MVHAKRQKSPTNLQHPACDRWDKTVQQVKSFRLAAATAKIAVP